MKSSLGNGIDKCISTELQLMPAPCARAGFEVPFSQLTVDYRRMAVKLGAQVLRMPSLSAMHDSASFSRLGMPCARIMAALSRSASTSRGLWAACKTIKVENPGKIRNRVTPTAPVSVLLERVTDPAQARKNHKNPNRTFDLRRRRQSLSSGSVAAFDNMPCVSAPFSAYTEHALLGCPLSKSTGIGRASEAKIAGLVAGS